MTSEQTFSIGNQLINYCKKYHVPFEYLFEILEDQKVTPMIRGKAMEYNAYLFLEMSLPKHTWSVQKLNLNAQGNLNDEDITITHRRTGVILKVESKSAVRGSISVGARSKVITVPHFKVKCHRSRSNISLAGTSNDRYSVDSFDLIVTQPSNAILEGNTVGENLEVVNAPLKRAMLFDYYNVATVEDLIQLSANDWRFCIPSDIAENGFLPRTPYVKLEDDPNWKPLTQLEQRLLQVVEDKRRANQTSRRS